MILFLEGGYNVDAQASIIYNVINVMSDWNLPLEKDSRSTKEGRGSKAVQAVLDTHRKYWQSLK